MRAKLFILLWLPISLSGQQMFDIQLRTTNQSNVCQRCDQVFASKPKEVSFAVRRDKDNTLYFEFNDKAWFNSLFKNEYDGIALDIVPKDRYGCLEVLLDVGQIRGELIKPVYARALKKTVKPKGNGRFWVRLGKLPAQYLNKDVEFNILFLSNRYLCRYQTIFDLKRYQWDLLKMGMYLDSLTYKTQTSAGEAEDRYTLKYKVLNFSIPFKKNKSVYSAEDIKPLYDSLRLTDFNITKININAYASVEGNIERNLELQEGRAKSIIDALQSFQKPTIVTEVATSENWVEFLRDIEGTQFGHLRDLNKQQTKEALRGELAQKLEPYLSKHRKAVIKLELEKRDLYKDKTVEALIGLFNLAIKEAKIEVANELQNSIFERLKRKEANPDVLNRMEIPRQVKFVPFFNKNSAIRYLLDERNLLIAYNELLALKKLDPDNMEVNYNLIALKLKLWRYNVQPIKDEQLKSEIGKLAGYGVSKGLIQRMMINYHIVRSEYLMRKGDYSGKDASVSFIYDNYSKSPMSDYDYLSLAQYLSYYSNLDMAVELLEDKVQEIEVDENLLFYYLNLTMVDRELTQQQDYRKIMLNAINMNKARFCGLFDAFGTGGVTFQLLEDDYLRDTYCENCEK